MIVETNGAGQAVREYVWLDDMPVAVLDGSATPANPTLLWVHTDHLKRPELMTDATKAVKWKAVYEPFGTVSSITGAAANQMRFPGQWFQLEAGLAYNWNRHYDSSTGRYTQPDPLGVLPSSSLYSYALSSPFMYKDVDGRCPMCVVAVGVGSLAAAVESYIIGDRISNILSNIYNNKSSKSENPKINADQSDPDSGEPVYPNNPDSAPDDFDRIKGRAAKECKDDGSIRERDRVGSRAHGDPQWKRWDNRRSWEKGTPSQSIWTDGRIRK